jgi:hypothetical protein
MMLVEDLLSERQQGVCASAWFVCVWGVAQWACLLVGGLQSKQWVLGQDERGEETWLAVLLLISDRYAGMLCFMACSTHGCILLLPCSCVYAVACGGVYIVPGGS